MTCVIARILTYAGVGLGVVWCAFTPHRRRGDVDGPLRPDRDPGPPHARDERRALRDVVPDLEEARHRVDPCRDEIEIRRDSETGPVVPTRVLIRTTSPIEPGPDELRWGSGREISKPEMEWIATTLRAVLGVPATDAPTGNAIRAGSDEPRGRHRPRRRCKNLFPCLPLAGVPTRLRWR